MFEKIKKYLSDSLSNKEVVKNKSELYDFNDNEEKETKKLRKINFLDRIKFIKFNKNNEKNKDVNMRKIKEVRTFSYSGCTYRNRLY